MKKKKSHYNFPYALFVALLGGFFILGLSPHPVHGISWHMPFYHRHAVSASHVEIAEPIFQEQPDPNSKLIPVLMYHHVEDLSWDQRQADPVRSDLTVSVADFETQVKYFSDLGYHSIKAKDLYESFALGKTLPAKPIIFTFDDGYKDVFTNAVPVLQKYGYTGSFAIATDLLGRPTYAVWSDIENADKVGMEILSHTENHLDLTSSVYSDNDLKREIFGSKTLLEANLGHKVDFFVYPYGHNNAHVADLLAQANYKMGFTTEFGVWMNPTTKFTEPRVRVHGLEGLEKLKKVLPN